MKRDEAKSMIHEDWEYVVDKIYDSFENKTCDSCKNKRHLDCPLDNLREITNEDEYISQDTDNEIELETRFQQLTVSNSGFHCNHHKSI